MKQSPLLGQKIAIQVANGFSEGDLISTQKVLQGLGATTRIVSMDQGLVNSWNGEAWGLNFATDQALNTALAADYDALVVPGGSRSIEKLKLTAHTRRFLNGFLATGKPVFAMNEAIDLLLFTETLDGRNVASADEDIVVDGNLMTCFCELDVNVLGRAIEAYQAFVLAAVAGQDDQPVAA